MVVVPFREIEFNFNKTFRVFVSGSSESGKTFFTHNLLKRKLFDYNRVYYFHPDFHETSPVNWNLDCPIIYSAEFPDIDFLLNVPEYSVIIFDDLVDKCFKSQAVDYLFRVLSGKRNLHVFILAQRYYTQGPYCVSIRNSSNYHVLMRYTDIAKTKQIGKSLGLLKEIVTASEYNDQKLYPYIFIDRTNLASVRKTQVYIDVLSDFFVIIRGNMKFYLLSEHDFKRSYKVIDSELAENENSPNKVLESPATKVDEKVSESMSEEGTNTEIISRQTSPKPSPEPKRKRESYRDQQKFDRRFRRAVYKYKISSKL